MMRTKADIVLLALAGCVAVAGLVQGNDSAEANIGLTGLVVGIVVWIAMLELDWSRPDRTPGRHAVSFGQHVERVLVVELVVMLVLEFTILTILFGSILALVLVVVEWDALLAVVCATAILTLARVAIPQTKSCVSSIRILYGRAEQA